MYPLFNNVYNECHSYKSAHCLVNKLMLYQHFDEHPVLPNHRCLIEIICEDRSIFLLLIQNEGKQRKSSEERERGEAINSDKLISWNETFTFAQG